MAQVKSFEDLECWKACAEVRRYVKNIIIKFPSEEKFGLTDNMRRASRSITQNLAEGFGRFHFKDNIRFCRITKGSLYELTDQLITAFDENYITREEYDKGKLLIDKSVRLVNGYTNYLRNADNRPRIATDIEIQYSVSDNPEPTTNNRQQYYYEPYIKNLETKKQQGKRQFCHLPGKRYFSGHVIP